MATEFPIMVWGGGADTWPTTLTKSVAANVGHVRVGGEWWSDAYITQAEKYAQNGMQFVVHFEFLNPDHYRAPVTYWKEWPNLFGYVLPDEPDRKPYITPSLITAIHNVITTIDNTKPTIHTNGFGSALYANSWQDYIGTTNITLFDYYWKQCTLGTGHISTVQTFLSSANTAFGTKGLDIATHQLGVFFQAFKETQCNTADGGGLVTEAEWDTIQTHVKGLTGNSVAGDRWGMFAIYAAFVDGYAQGRIHLDSQSDTGEDLREIAFNRCKAAGGNYIGTAGATWSATTGSAYAVSTWPSRPTPASGSDVPSNTQPPPPGVNNPNGLDIPRRISIRTGESYRIPINNGTSPYTLTLSNAPSGTQIVEGSIIAGSVTGRADLTIVDSSAPTRSATATVSVYDCGCATTN